MIVASYRSLIPSPKEGSSAGTLTGVFLGFKGLYGVGVCWLGILLIEFSSHSSLTPLYFCYTSYHHLSKVGVVQPRGDARYILSKVDSEMAVEG